MNAKSNGSMTIVDYRKLPSPVEFGRTFIQYYAVIDDCGEKKALPVPEANSVDDMIENLYFDEYRNLKYSDFHKHNNMVDFNRFVEYLSGKQR